MHCVRHTRLLHLAHAFCIAAAAIDRPKRRYVLEESTKDAKRREESSNIIIDACHLLGYRRRKWEFTVAIQHAHHLGS